MPKLYMISDPEHPLILPNYTPSEKDASRASIKGKTVHMTEVHWQVMEAKVTFAPVEPIDPVDWGQE